jgi:hypothetical protein
MRRKQQVLLLLIVLLFLSGIVAVRVWTPAFDAATACQSMIERTEGYGPWQARGPDPLVRTREGTAILTYFDGYNTASCHAKQYGPLWFVVGVGQTNVACSRELNASRDQPCPRGVYGVTP